MRCVGVPGRREIYRHSGLYAPERYVEGLLALRPRLRHRLVFGTIAGIPPDLNGQPEEALLADARLVERVDPDNPTRLEPSCFEPGRGFASPPRRLLEVGRGIVASGGRTVHVSICDDDFTPAVAVILEEIRDVARPICRADDD